MDRCHRIGQNRPVLVFRLATSHSVEGKMLRRACDKMALERLVIKKGVFKEVLDVGVDADKVRAGGGYAGRCGWLARGMSVARSCFTGGFDGDVSSVITAYPYLCAKLL